MQAPKLTAISPHDAALIEARIAALRSWYSTFQLAPVNQCEFQGSKGDVDALDFILYELPTATWEHDHGVAHACAWGNVLVRQFGFAWCKHEGDTSPRHFAVRHHDVPCIVFPWPRLYELTSTRDPDQAVHGNLLISVIAAVHRRTTVPDGWHPVLDMLAGRRPDVSRDVMRMVERVDSIDPDWLMRLGTWPFDWTEHANWDRVRAMLRDWRRA